MTLSTIALQAELWLLANAPATPTPEPTPTFDPAQVTPGPIGFFATIALFLAVGLIAMRFMHRMSRLQARYQVREQLEAEAEAAKAEGAAVDGTTSAAEGSTGTERTDR